MTGNERVVIVICMTVIAIGCGLIAGWTVADVLEAR